MSNELSSLQAAQLIKTTNILQGMGCSYRITTPDGQMHEHKVKVKAEGKNGARTHRAPMHPRGELRTFVSKYLDEIQPGQVVYVPFDKFDPYSIQAGCGNFLAKKHGHETYITRLHREKAAVEVLFVGKI